ncbi:UxaA family hydrolase [Vibrio gangliei]|uniref:UxaA family hydrolase n=1 Tax=Vibrio gangliei TaxID=2077090 RepID=UPI000D0126E0|nr:altronate dehydratase family protein [Vibrio gangliei]
MKTWIRIHPKDNVIIALVDLAQGDNIEVDTDCIIELNEPITKGHKIALTDLNSGDLLWKYGESFGHATETIQAGSWVHSHNSKTNLSDKLEYRYQPELVESLTAQNEIDVEIYRRKNGDVGIRNELWIIPTVGCVNGIAQTMANQFLAEHPQLDIDGVHVFPHQFGCSQLGDDHITTRNLLQSIAKHPNAGGVLVLGLGCENNQVPAFMQGLGDYDPSRIQYLISQTVENEIEAGKTILNSLYETMRHDKRTPGKLSEIHFGLECGGSDGLSGITANPLLGQFSDFVIAQGGTTVLTEVPEMFGAETLLMKRAANQQVFEKIVNMINGFKDYYTQHNLPIYENPSPGNKAGGITTLEDKSLGCTQKSGTSPVMDVLDYSQKLSTPGLNLLNAPGNDAIATSALAASGCHMVLFSTGRGTPYGGFVPTVKIATNTELAEKKKHWIDFNAGTLVSNDIPMEQLLTEFVEKIVAIVNGDKTRNEINQIREIAIWKSGVTL